MRLHHVTRRKHCASIAERGLRDSHRHATGVYLSPPGALWVCGGPGGLEDMANLPDDQVVFAFDVPDEIAAQYAGYEKSPTLDDKGDDIPEDLDDDDGFPADPVAAGWVLYEYVIPAEIVNRYFAGIVHWTGERPLTDGQLARMMNRCT